MSLLEPDVVAALGPAPETFVASLHTSAGSIEIDVVRAWSPHGADRFFQLVSAGFYDNVYFYRVIAGFMAQCGLHGDPAVTKAWRDAFIPDDPVVEANTPGRVSFATSGPNRRTTQIFVNTGDNRRLDGMGFSPFGQVRSLDVVKALNADYGESYPSGKGPRQSAIHKQGNALLESEYPGLDRIIEAAILP